MEHRTLGQAGLEVPVIGMGTWRAFDVRGAVAEQNARAVVDAAFASGANFFDSSPMYGAAEAVLGAALGGRRAEALVATKVWANTAAEGRAQAERALAFYAGFVVLYLIQYRLLWPVPSALHELLPDHVM